MFLCAILQHLKKNKQSVKCVMYISLDTNLEKISKIDLAEEAEVIVLSNH